MHDNEPIRRSNVLIVVANGYLGGAEGFVTELAAELRESRKVAPVVVFFADGPAADACRKAGVPVRVLQNRFRMRNILQLSRALLELRAVAKELQPAAVHSTMPYCHIAATLATLSLPVRRVWFQHGPVGGLLDSIAKFLPVDYVLFNSAHTKSVHDRLPGFKPRMGDKVVPYTVRPPANDKGHTENLFGFLPEHPAPIVIGTAGRITEWKGYHNLVRAAELLRDELPGDVWERCHFVVFGSANGAEDERYHESLIGMIGDAELGGHVHMVGFRSNLHEYMHAMDVFVHCSVVPEPFGRVVAEAMLHRALVIGGNTGGVTELLRDKDTGLTFDAASSEAPRQLASQLAFALREIVAAKDRSEEPFAELKDRAQRLVAEERSFGVLVAAMEEVYTATQVID